MPAYIFDKTQSMLQENTMTEQINAFQIAQQQFDSVAETMNLDQGVRDVLRWPAREFTFQYIFLEASFQWAICISLRAMAR
jgi:hypothetical protein